MHVTPINVFININFALYWTMIIFYNIFLWHVLAVSFVAGKSVTFKFKWMKYNFNSRVEKYMLKDVWTKALNFNISKIITHLNDLGEKEYFVEYPKG